MMRWPQAPGEGPSVSRPLGFYSSPGIPPLTCLASPEPLTRDPRRLPAIRRRLRVQSRLGRDATEHTTDGPDHALRFRIKKVRSGLCTTLVTAVLPAVFFLALRRVIRMDRLARSCLLLAIRRQVACGPRAEGRRRGHRLIVSQPVPRKVVGICRAANSYARLSNKANHANRNGAQS